MNNNVILGALAMDLKRAALGYHRGSLGTAHRFFEEALKRKKEIDQASVKPYIRKLLSRIDSLGSQRDTERIAEDALMYSTLLQNAALVK